MNMIWLFENLDSRWKQNLQKGWRQKKNWQKRSRRDSRSSRYTIYGFRLFCNLSFGSDHLHSLLDLRLKVAVLNCNSSEGEFRKSLFVFRLQSDIKDKNIQLSTWLVRLMKWVDISSIKIQYHFELPIHVLNYSELRCTSVRGNILLHRSWITALPSHLLPYSGVASLPVVLCV